MLDGSPISTPQGHPLHQPGPNSFPMASKPPAAQERQPRSLHGLLSDKGDLAPFQEDRGEFFCVIIHV